MALCWQPMAALGRARQAPQRELCTDCGRGELARRTDDHNEEVHVYCRMCGAIQFVEAEEVAGDDRIGSAGNTVKFHGGGVDSFARRLRHNNAMQRSLIPPAVLDRAIMIHAAEDLPETAEGLAPCVQRAAAELAVPCNGDAVRLLFGRHAAFTGVNGMAPKKATAGKAAKMERYGNTPKEMTSLAADCLQQAAGAAGPAVAAAIAADLAGPRLLPVFAAEFVAAAAALGIGYRHELRSRIAPAVAVALVAMGCTPRSAAAALRGHAGPPQLRREMYDAAPRLASVFERAKLPPPPAKTVAARQIIALLKNMECY